jgi:multimeric flavodoxin WrbA
MKITCILGSPRINGNSAAIAGKFCEIVKKKGAEVKRFELNKMNYRGCQGCMACKTKFDKCILKDDLASTLNSVKSSDITVLASSVYFGDVTAQTKGFIDRTYSNLKPTFYTDPENASRLEKGKKLIFILVQGAPKEKFTDIYPRYEYFFKWQFEEVHLLRECDMIEKNSAKNSEKIMLNAKTIAMDLNLLK